MPALVGSCLLLGSGILRGQDSVGGGVAFPVSCTTAAQAEFSRAAALLHHMTYPEARRGFLGALARDPQCAMGHWGVAMTLFQPLWPNRPSAAELERGRDEVQAGLALGPPTERERLFLLSVEAFFTDPDTADYWTRIGRWEAALARLEDAFPGDPEVRSFHALALLATLGGGKAPPNARGRAVALLRSVYAGDPEHPGALHYLVHAHDAPGQERALPDVTARYESVAPANPHALHMPTHIYTRLGDWDGVIRGNLRAADAALATRVGEHEEFIWDEYPHAIEYLVYAYLQEARWDDATAAVSRLHRMADLQPGFKTAFHLASTEARLALERRDWRAAAAVVPRAAGPLDWDRFAWPEAVSWFARGLGSAQLGERARADSALSRIAALERRAREGGEDVFAANIEMLRLELEGCLAQARGAPALAEERLRQAVRLEATTPKHAVTPAPTLPASEMLGDLLARQGRPEPALRAYQRALAAYPRRLRALLGAAEAATAAGQARLASRFRTEVRRVTGGRAEVGASLPSADRPEPP